MNIFNRLLSTKYMVKPEMQKGDIPPSRKAYGKSLRIAIPAVIEMVSLAIMDMIDVIMVGVLGAYAITAVGITNQPRMLVFSVFFALNIAITAIIARKKGAGEMDAARSCLRHSLILNVILGLVATILAVLFAYPLMRLAGAQTVVIDDAASYFTIINYVLVLQIVTSTICVAQRAIGNTKITLKVNVIAKIIGVVFNFLLIEGRFGFPALGVEGAAWARVIAAVVAFALAMHSVLHKNSPLRIKLTDYWGFEQPMLKSIGRLTYNGLLEQAGLRFGFFAYARVVADLGPEAFAAHIIAQQVMILSFTFADGIGAATTSLVGQNLGKKRPDLSIMYGKIGMRMAIICALVLSGLCVLFRFHFAAMFAPYDPNVVIVAGELLLIFAFVMPLQTAQLVMGGSLRGAGDTRFVALTMLLTVGLMRPILGWGMAFPLGLGIAGAWLAIIIDQGARLIMLFTRFARGKWISAKV